MYLELINNTLTTMLLDCISHYTERGQQKECFGLIFGEQNENATGEYTFPIGNVMSQSHHKLGQNIPFQPSEIVQFERILKLFNPLEASFTRTLKKEAFEQLVVRDDVI